MAAWFAIAASVLALATSAAKAPPAPRPKLGHVVVASTDSGTVLVKGNGGHFTRLSRTPTALPVGATIDATRGRVKLITATGTNTRLNSGLFDHGAFIVSQGMSPNGLTDLQLVGGSCPVGAAPPASGPSATVAGLPRSRILRVLRGSAHGNFRTMGQAAAATVRGTKWLTEDTCDRTTLISDQRGVVQTTDLHGYLNLGALSLGPGDSSWWYCQPNGQPPISTSFCTTAVSNPGNGLIGAGIVNFGPDTKYELCITEPSSTVNCIPMVPFSAPQPDGRRISAVVCTAY
ncbi:MAG: hypothetical protein ACYDAR_22435, partial [Thermomicrobiales bacterium]